jgi:hypothetical protein
VIVTEELAGAREVVSKHFQMYGNLPSYRAMLESEGVDSAGDLAIVGDELAIEDAIRSLASSGVTDLNAVIVPLGNDPRAAIQRTQELLAELARS